MAFGQAVRVVCQGATAWMSVMTWNCTRRTIVSASRHNIRSSANPWVLLPRSCLQAQSLRIGTFRSASTSSSTLSLKSSLHQTLSLHASALWARHKAKVFSLTAIAAVWLMWWLIDDVANNSVFGHSAMAEEWASVALAVAIVALAFQYARWYYGVNPKAVYEQTMLKLNTSPAALEVIGAPLTGSELRAYIVTGGNLYMSHKSHLWPKISCRRLQMIFPLRGSERDGLASVEVKRRQGRYVFKLLAVDVRPLHAHHPPARIFVEGGQEVYERNSLLGELRDPFLRAMTVQKQVDKEHELEDEMEDPGENRFVGFFRHFLWPRIAAASASLSRIGSPSTVSNANVTADTAGSRTSIASQLQPEAVSSMSAAQASSQQGSGGAGAVGAVAPTSKSPAAAPATDTERVSSWLQQLNRILFGSGQKGNAVAITPG